MYLQLNNIWSLLDQKVTCGLITIDDGGECRQVGNTKFQSLEHLAQLFGGMVTLAETVRAAPLPTEFDDLACPTKS